MPELFGHGMEISGTLQQKLMGASAHSVGKKSLFRDFSHWNSQIPNYSLFFAILEICLHALRNDPGNISVESWHQMSVREDAAGYHLCRQNTGKHELNVFSFSDLCCGSGALLLSFDFCALQSTWARKSGISVGGTFSQLFQGCSARAGLAEELTSCELWATKSLLPTGSPCKPSKEPTLWGTWERELPLYGSVGAPDTAPLCVCSRWFLSQLSGRTPCDGIFGK